MTKKDTAAVAAPTCPELNLLFAFALASIADPRTKRRHGSHEVEGTVVTKEDASAERRSG
jgi:hypothetical protein